MIEFIDKIVKNDVQTFREWQFENIKILKDSFEYKIINEYYEI
jgi:hypothetical protein